MGPAATGVVVHGDDKVVSSQTFGQQRFGDAETEENRAVEKDVLSCGHDAADADGVDSHTCDSFLAG